MVGVSPGAQIADRLAGFALRRIHKRGNTVFFPKYSKPFPWFLCAFFACGLWCVKLFFSVKNLCVEGHATEVWNGVLKRTAWLLKRKQQPGGAIRTEQANLSFHSTWCRYFPSFPSLCEKPYLTSHATHFFSPKWGETSLVRLSIIFSRKKEGFSLSLEIRCSILLKFRSWNYSILGRSFTSSKSTYVAKISLIFPKS